MSTNINSTEQIVEINAGDQITNVNIVSQSTTQVISGEQVVTVDVNAGTIPAAWGSITGTLSNQTDLQNALNAKQNNITLTTTGTTGVATLVGATLNIPNYVSSTKQSEWDSAYNDKINSAEVSGTTTKTLTLTQQDGGIIQASWSDFDTAPVTSVFGRTGDVVATEGDYNINQLGDVTITSATNGQVLKYNGTAWVNAADASGLTSVGLAMPSAFTVSGSPLTSNGTITVIGAGTTSQYVRGDGSLAAFPSVSNEAKTLIREVYNKTGATLAKGTVIYIDGGQGNLPTVTKAIATGDPTSAQTFGIVQSDITNMNNGFVVVAGGIDNLDTQAYPEGTALYLSPTTAGAWTSTKPYAPDHMVYLGVVVRSHPTQGVIEVKIQNGVELDEIHDVSARFPVNKDGLFYNSTSGVWENKSIAGVLGYTPVPETRIITINGTAQNLSADRTWNVGTVTSVAASGGTGISISGSPVTGSGTISITNTAPDQIVSLTGAGTTSISGTYPNFTVTSNDQYVGTVTSVNATVPTGFEVSGVPITSSGTVDIKFASGYSLPTTAKQTQWDDAYAKRIDSLTVTGNSGSATLTSNVLNVPTYTLTGLGGEPAITAGTTSQYWRGDKSFQTLDTSVVPENGNVYFTEQRVRATVLSGLNITGGSISASDSVLNAFGKVQNQINGLIGGSIFQSTWNASTNTPTLTSGVGTKGYYYIVSVAGTTNLDGITDWQIGDWAIFDGTVWRKVDNTDAVVSVNGYTGVVNLVLDDLADVSAASPTDTQLLRFNGTTSKWYNWTPTFEPALTKGNLTEATSSVLTITGGSNAVIGSGTTIQVKQSSATGSGFLSSTDWTTFNNKQNALTNPVTGTGVDTRLAIWTGTNTISNDVNLTFDGVTLSVNGRYRTGGSASNTVKFKTGDGSPLTETFNTVIADGANARTAFFRGNSTGGASVWWGALDSNGDNIPLAAADANYTDGGLSFWRNSGGVGGGAWTRIFTYDGNGVKLDVVSALGTAATSFIVSDSGLLKTRTATQVRSDIGAAAASDLSNYLPLTGGTITGFTKFSYDNNYVSLNRSATDKYIGFLYETAGDNQWFIGLRELSNNNYYIYNETLSNNAVTISVANNNATFAGSVTASISALATAATLFVVSDSGTLKSRTAAQVLSDIGGQAAGNYVTLDTTQTITGRKTISYGAATFGGTTQSLLIDGATQNGALTINSNGTSPYAYQTFAQGGVAKFEMGIVGTSSDGSLYINSNIQVGEAGASIFISKTNGRVGILNIDPQHSLDVTGNIRAILNQNGLTRVLVSNTTAGTASYVETSYTTDSSGGSAAVGKYSSLTTAYKIVTASNTYLYNGGAGDLAILNDFATGAIKMAAGGSSSAHFTIASTGAATFSSSITASIAALGTAATLFIVSDSGTLKSRTAAQVLSDIGAQAAGNYVTLDTTQTITGKKTFSTSYGDNDPIVAFVGTGTDTFQYLTTAYNASLGAGKNACHFFGRGSATKNSAYIGFQYNDANSNTNFLTLGIYGNDHLLKIYGSGNATFANFLGVGKDPDYKLQVYTDADVWHAVFGSSTGQLRIGGQTSDGAVIQAASPDYTTKRLLYLQRDGSNVIINGTTDTGDRLQVNGTARISSRLGIGATSATYSIQLGTVGSLSNSIRLGTYAVAKNTRQYIGYTRDDTGFFEISGDGDTPSTVMPGVSGIRIVNTEGTVAAAQADNSVQILTHIYNGNSRIALHASYNGRVGINGVTAPAQALDVSGSIRQSGVTSSMLKTNASGDIIAAVAGTDYQAAGSYVTTNTTQTIASRKTISLEAQTYGGTVQSFLIDGAAGNGALTINAAADYAYLTFAQAGTAKIEIGCEGASTNKGSLYINKNIQTGSNGASIYIKKSDGYVGINNTNPQYFLDVSGSVRTTNSFISTVSNSYGLVLNRPAATNYNGISLQTANVARWYIGMRENLSSNNFICYSEQTATDVMTLNIADSSATFAGNLFNSGLFRTRGSSNTVYWNSGGATASFGAILGNGDTSNRTAFFRGANSSNPASAWWGYADANGNNVPVAAIDGNAAGGLGFWSNSAGTGGGTWTNIMNYTITGLGVFTQPSFPLHVYTSGDVWHVCFDGGTGQLRFGAETGSGAVIQARTSAGATRSLYLNRDGGEVYVNTTTDAGAYALQVSGSTYSSTGFFESSDIRLKDILNKHESVDFGAIEFKWNDGRDSKLHWGYAAQEVMKWLPDAVSGGGDKFYTLDYTQVHTYKIAMLEKRIVELESQLKNK